jgi:3-dehydroquinate synthase
MAEPVEVALGTRSYRVHIGAGVLDEVGARVRETVGTPSRIAIISDTRVAALHLGRVQTALAAAGFAAADVVTIPPGEGEKRLATVERVCEALAAAGADRRSLVLALGGGVVGDLSGLVAALYMRGIAFAQLPTTLLAQVDASVGGKTAVDLGAGKNLVGAFHQPSFVSCDVRVLSTLPPREVRAGLAEVLKAGLIADPELFELLERRGGEAAALTDPALTEALVRRAVAVKAGIVSRDERESGERALLNLGHTYGHAIEAAAGYGPVLHGEAVALGMVAACRVAERIGVTAGLEARVSRALVGLGLAVDLEPWLRPDVLAHTQVDKKRTGKALRFVLPEGLGRVRLHDLTVKDLAEYLRIPAS